MSGAQKPKANAPGQPTIWEYHLAANPEQYLVMIAEPTCTRREAWLALQSKFGHKVLGVRPKQAESP